MHSFEPARFILSSLCIHGAVILLFFLIPDEHVLRQTFLVHPEDKKEAYTFYKPVSTIGTYIPETTKTPPKKPDAKKTDSSIKKEQTTITQEQPTPPPAKEIPKPIEKKQQEPVPAPEKKPVPPEHPKQKNKEASKKPQEKIEKKEETKKELVPSKEQNLESQKEKTQAQTPQNTTQSRKIGTPKKSQRIALYQALIQQAISQAWHPPVGMPKGTECAVYIKVNRQGEIISTKITQPSPIIVFTLSIQRALSTCRFNQHLWGKSFTVTFRQ